MANSLLDFDNISHSLIDPFNSSNITHQNFLQASLPPTWLVNVLEILYTLTAIIGLSGNTLVIYVVLRFSKMQTVTNLYLFNLALADEIYLIGIPFFVTTSIREHWTFGDTLCRVYFITSAINQFTSSLLLTVMSADRYVAVCHPIASPRYRTPFVAKIICLTVWTVSALLMSPIIIYSGLEDRPDGKLTCAVAFPENSAHFVEAFTIYQYTLGFLVPFTLIILFYILVICKLRTVGPKKKSREKRRSHRKVTILVLTVITVYLICWLPYEMAQVVIIFFSESRLQNSIGTTFTLFASWLLYVNSAVNPILYAFLSDNFKKSFLKAFTCAAGKDVNAQLNVENSVFPKANSCANHGRKSGAGGTNQGGKHHDKDYDDHGEPATFVNLITQDSHLADECPGGAATAITDYDDESDGEEEDEEYVASSTNTAKRARHNQHRHEVHEMTIKRIYNDCGNNNNPDSVTSAPGFQGGMNVNNELVVMDTHSDCEDSSDKQNLLVNGYTNNNCSSSADKDITQS